MKAVVLVVLTGALTIQTMPSPDLLWTLPPEAFTWGQVSPDGAMLAYGNRDDGEIYVRDLRTGRNRRVTDEATPGDLRSDPQSFGDDWFQFSRNGRYLAYPWRTGRDESLRIIDLTRRDFAPSRVLFSEPGVQFTSPSSWSADDNSLLFDVARHGSSGSELRVAHVRDGTIRILKAANGNQFAKNAFFSPDGQTVAYRRGPAAAGTEDIVLLSLESGAESVLIAGTRDTLIGWINGGLIFVRRAPSGAAMVLVPLENGKPAEARTLTPSFSQGEPLGVSADGTALYSNSPSDRWRTSVVSIDWRTGRLRSSPLLLPGSDGNVLFAGEWSPDGAALLEFSGPGSAGGRGVWIRRAGDGWTPRRLPLELPSIESVTWSPDGRYLLVVGVDPKRQQGIFAADISTGSLKVVAPRATLMHRFSADSGLIYFERAVDDGSGQSAIIARDISAGTETMLAKGAGGWKGRTTRALSPDGRMLYQIRPDTGAGSLRDVVVRNLETNEIRTISKDVRVESLAMSPRGRFVIASVEGDAVLVPAAGGVPIRLPNVPGQRPAILAWSPQEDAVVVRVTVSPENSVRRDALWWISLAGGAPRAIPGSYETVASVLAAAGPLAVVERLGRLRPPTELWAVKNIIPISLPIKR